VKHNKFFRFTPYQELGEMSQPPGSHEYIERVRAAATILGCQENVPEARTSHAAKPFVLWLNGTPRETNDLDEVFALAQNGDAISRKAVCIVEDISWEWIGAMGITWGIEPQFFAEHGVNPQGDNPWRAFFPEDRRLGAPQGSSKYKYMDGVFEHHYLANHQTALDILNNSFCRSAYRRRCWNSNDSSYPPSSNTRVSYCRVNANLCMITCSMLSSLTYLV
jgi:hypothetical protein